MKIEFLFEDELDLRKPIEEHPSGVPTCCRVEDEETGIVVISTKGINRQANKLKAMEVISLWKNE